MTHSLTTSHILAGELAEPKDLKGGGLDFAAYSRMKHGSKQALQQLAKDLAGELIAEHPHLVEASEEVLLPVAYVAVPPSCFYLAKYIAEELNQSRRERSLLPARIVRISKSSVANTDYARATLAEREAELASITFKLDESIAGAHVLLVDDVRVTGMAEKAALQALAHEKPASLILGYVATVDESLQHSPHIEAFLNHHSVKSLRDVIPLVKAEDFVITIRFLKYFLKASLEDQRYFIKHAPNSLLREMLDACEATGDRFMEDFASGVKVLRKALKRRERVALGYLHKGEDEGSVVIRGEVEFDEYSRFKYGDGAISQKYGTALAQEALALIPKNCSKIFVTSSGFAFVPPAAHSLVYPFVEELNRLQKKEVYPFKVERTSISNGDYAKMTKEQRKKELSSHNLFVDYSVDLTDAFVISIDDVRITGTHELALERTLKEAGAKRVKHLYVIDAWDERRNPHTEAMLNLFSIQELSSFIATVKVPHFTPNARFCKHVINLPERDMHTFLTSVSGWITLWLDAAIKADHLEDYPAYAAGVEVYAKVRKRLSPKNTARRAFRRYVNGSAPDPRAGLTS